MNRQQKEKGQSVRRRTISEKRWPDTPEFNSALRKLQNNGSVVLLGFVWSGYDKLTKEVLGQVDWMLDEEDLERDITQLLEVRIQECMSGYEPYYVQHGPYERETRIGKGQPPEYDIAFVLRSNERVMWPLEAKVLRTDGSVAEYIKEIRANFLTCRYAPFSSEGAMLGYLLTGSAETAFKNIAKKLHCALDFHSEFQERDHRISNHKRIVRKGKSYPRDFKCHHVLLRLRMHRSAG